MCNLKKGGNIMENIKGIKISKETLKEWKDRFIPEYDYFYFEHVKDATKYNLNSFLMVREELASNLILNTLDTLTAYTPWRVNKNAKYVAVISNSDFSKLNTYEKKEIFYLQWKLGRGQIWDLSVLQQVFENITISLEDYTFSTEEGKKIIIQRTLWEQFSDEKKEIFLMIIAEMFIDEADTKNLNYTEEISEYSILKPYLNRFPSKSGPNCFASVLGALSDTPTTTEWIINQWIQPKTFLLNLTQLAYKEVSRITNIKSLCVEPGDILVWFSEDMNPVHTCFVLNSKIVFNKNGQTMFNPWQTITLETVMKAWKYVIYEHGFLSVYRRDCT
jgi:hypothetical protein